MSKKKIAVGLFSNLQGIETGARRAGFLTPFSTDYDEDVKEAAKFLCDGQKHEFLVKDILELQFSDIQKSMELAGTPIQEGDVDLLVGGPPCFGMTLLNTKFRSVFHRDSLLMLEMVRIIGQMQPKVVLIEQVPAIFQKQLRPFYIQFINSIQKLGNYHIDHQVLNAMNFNCLQSRKRAIFILVRKDLGVLPCFPVPQKVDLSKQSAYNAIGAELIKISSYKKQSRGKQRVTDGYENVFPTLTSDRIDIFRNGLWQELTIADRKILAHMEEFDMCSIFEEHILRKKLGMMVIPPFAEALCRNIMDEILLKAA